MMTCFIEVTVKQFKRKPFKRLINLSKVQYFDENIIWLTGKKGFIEIVETLEEIKGKLTK